MIERPIHASHHCRHYSYERGLQGGPRCARGVDMTPLLATQPCMPDAKAPCIFREEYTDEERAAWKAYREESAGRMITIMAQIPGSSRDRKNKPEWGKRGSFPCPGCNAGTVHWARESSNGHLHAACTTRFCFDVME